MAINTFMKDCKDSDKHIRGLAIRQMCNLRFEGIQEYMLVAIKEGLKDEEGYVRKTAVMGVIKLYYLDNFKLLSEGIIDQLYEMIKDNSHLVVMNAILVLNEILHDQNGITYTIIYHIS